MLSWFDSHLTLFFPDDAARNSAVLTLFFPALPVFLTPSSLDTAAVFPRPCPVADAAALAAVLRVTLVGRATCGGLFATFFTFVGLVSLLLAVAEAEDDFCSSVDFLPVALVGFAAARVTVTFLTFVFDVPLVTAAVVVVAVVLVVALVERS